MALSLLQFSIKTNDIISEIHGITKLYDRLSVFLRDEDNPRKMDNTPIFEEKS